MKRLIGIFVHAFKDKWPPEGMNGTLPVPYGDKAP
jgi:hypothetical protein